MKDKCNKLTKKGEKESRKTKKDRKTERIKILYVVLNQFLLNRLNMSLICEQFYFLSDSVEGS